MASKNFEITNNPRRDMRGIYHVRKRQLQRQIIEKCHVIFLRSGWAVHLEIQANIRYRKSTIIGNKSGPSSRDQNR